MAAFFLALFNALGAIPSFERMMNSAISAWNEYKKSKRDADIDEATKASATAVTSDDVEKAVDAAAKANRDL